MINLPQCPPLERLIASKRLPALFIGSGISKRYLVNFPDWNDLLLKISKKINIKQTVFSARKNKIKVDNPTISECTINLLMADYLRNTFLDKIEKDEIELEKIFSEEELEMCINGTDYFKMLVSQYFLNYTINPDKIEEIKYFRKINSKISSIFTTNYDNFLQNEIFQDYKVYDEQNKYYFRESTGFGEIYKIHGSISNPNNIIICKNDYNYFNENLKIIASKLLNTLLDFPIIFLGYSLEDENVKTILSNFINSFDSNIIEEVKKFIILIEYKEREQKLIVGEKQFTSPNGKTIFITTIKTDNYLAVFSYIDKLMPSATAYELRKYKSMLANIIYNASKGCQTIYAKDISDAKNDDIAIYIGTQETIKGFSKSTMIFSNEEILLSALKNEKISFNDFALNWFESKAIQSTIYTGCFYIKKHMTIPNGSLKFERNLAARKKYFDNMKIKKRPTETLTDLLNELTTHKDDLKFNVMCRNITYKAIELSLLNLININEFRNLLLKIYDANKNIIKESEFRKAICFLTYKEIKNSTEV